MYVNAAGRVRDRPGRGRFAWGAGLAGALLLGWSTVAVASEFYVRQTTGNDGADGRSPATAWQHVAMLSAYMRAGEVRLDAEMTKARTSRTFPMTDELRALLEAQREYTRAIEREHTRVIPWVFHRKGERIRGFRRAWRSVWKAAGCPGRPVHDLPRTAVRSLYTAPLQV